ncbi:MAG: cold shock domain-containing protein [Alphaproteobacteria bacterium]|jgi:CspA family cold shock protein|nr:cold shock domain-containing protein [Alphaproteobacteria bacterium]
MSTGTVSSYDKSKGFGYIAPDEGGAPVFVSFREVIRAEIGPLQVGQRLRFEFAAESRFRMATDLMPEAA